MLSPIGTSVGLQPARIREAIIDRLHRSLGKPLAGATRRDFYDALAVAIREELAARWISTGDRVARARVKRVCYLSMEFLPARILVTALSSSDNGWHEEVREAPNAFGQHLDRCAAAQQDPGMGNGGLGLLAACFLDSVPTLSYAA